MSYRYPKVAIPDTMSTSTKNKNEFSWLLNVTKFAGLTVFVICSFRLTVFAVPNSFRGINFRIYIRLTTFVFPNRLRGTNFRSIPITTTGEVHNFTTFYSFYFIYLLLALRISGYNIAVPGDPHFSDRD